MYRLALPTQQPCQLADEVIDNCETSDMASEPPTNALRRQRHSIAKRTSFAQRNNQLHDQIPVEENESDDDLDIDLAKAALQTGTAAFDAQQWMEAESLLHEALRVLKQLPEDRRAFCDMFDLHFKLAVCTYYTQHPATAEEAITSLAQHPISSSEHRERMCDATHLLSQLYIRMGRIDTARSECEKNLQARRRLLGKQSDAALKSMALMAHIYVLLDNRALAKTYLAMIPEAQRDAVLKTISGSLGTGMEHLEFSSVMQPLASESSDTAAESAQSNPSMSSPGLSKDSTGYNYLPGVTSSPVPSRSSIATSASSPQFWQPSPKFTTENPGQDGHQSGWSTPSRPMQSTLETGAMLKQTLNEGYATTVNTTATQGSRPSELLHASQSPTTKTMSRKDILDKIGCHPRDNIEEAVCKGDHATLSKLLDKKKGFWRSSLRKHVRPERVTALHFAALFGEIDMARRLLAANYNVNEVPFGYSTSLTPLHFAIGARQVEMVQFLITNGARPAEPDTWSTLASQLMTRSWLMKTMADVERDVVADRIIAILNILLNAGWQINSPYGTVGGTVLHQAVSFWTGSYRWDLELRAAVTSFLCSRGADPFLANKDGKTANDVAVKEGHQDLVRILNQRLGSKEMDSGAVELVELPGQSVKADVTVRGADKR